MKSRRKKCNMILCGTRSLSTHLNGMNNIVSEQACSQFVDRGPVDVLQSAEQPSVQVTPVIFQSRQVKVLNKQLELVDNLVHLDKEKTGHHQHHHRPPLSSKHAS